MDRSKNHYSMLTLFRILKLIFLFFYYATKVKMETNKASHTSHTASILAKSSSSSRSDEFDYMVAAGRLDHQQNPEDSDVSIKNNINYSTILPACIVFSFTISCAYELYFFSVLILIASSLPFYSL